MGFAGDVLGFEKVNLKEMGRKVKDNPERLLIGAMDPASSKVWSKVTGKDYEPITDQWGGASNDTYRTAEAQGVDTKAGKNMHTLAKVIASMYAMSYAAGAAGSAGSAGSAGAGETGGGAAGSQGTWATSMSKYGQGLSAMGGGARSQEAPPPEVHTEPVNFTQGPNLYALSSKTLKQPMATMRGVIERGAAEGDPIDSIGVEVGAIQELSRRIRNVRARIQELKGSSKQ